MNPIYTFGYKLAELTKQNEAASVGLLCLAFKDAGKNTTQGLTYQDFKSVFQSQLPKRLEMLKLTNRDQVLLEMTRELNQNQSIFTLSAH